MLLAVTLVMVYHGKSVLYAVWCAVVACVPVFVLLGVHLLGMMCKRVAEPRTPIGIAVFLLFQCLSYGAMFLLALPWYFVLVPVYLLGRFVAGKVRERRARHRARSAPQSLPGS